MTKEKQLKELLGACPNNMFFEANWPEFSKIFNFDSWITRTQ